MIRCSGGEEEEEEEEEEEGCLTGVVEDAVVALGYESDRCLS